MNSAIVIPSVGRPSLQRLLDTLAVALDALEAGDLAPEQVVVADDRPAGGERLTLRSPLPCTVIRTGGRGPAAARNAGWRSAGDVDWLLFLDDDVELPPAWARELVADLAGLGPEVGGSQGRLHVPLPAGRRPTDWERGTAGLTGAAWATADMAYRRTALEAVSGFDERFPRAYREDADLALRVRQAGWTLVRGDRTTIHPVRPADDLVSLRVQRGNADDVLMRRLHGRAWRTEGEVPAGRLPWHAATVAALTAAGLGVAARRPRVAAAGGVAWLGLAADFARRRLAPGPRPGEQGWAAEWRRMLLTSVAIPPAAVGHRLAAEWRLRRGVVAWPPPLRAVLFDRDGTLVLDVPYNGDPALVRPVEGAREAVAAVRTAGLRTGVVSNQSGIARGLTGREQVDAVNAEVDRQVGPFDDWQLCPHGEADGCGCRKPEAGMVLAAARRLGVRPEECAVIGDIGADVGAALAAGARPVLVPTPATKPAEIAAAPLVAPDLRAAVGLLLGRPAVREPA